MRIVGLSDMTTDLAAAQSPPLVNKGTVMTGTAFDQIAGKTITCVVYKNNPQSPRQQVFLIFDDDTHFEIYGAEGESVKGAKGVDPGGLEEVERVGQQGQKIQRFPESLPDDKWRLRQGQRRDQRASRPRAIVLSAFILGAALIAASLLSPRMTSSGQLLWVSIAGQTKVCHVSEPAPTCWGWN